MDDPGEDDLLRVIEFLDTSGDNWDEQNQTPEDTNAKRYEEVKFLAAGGMKEIHEVYDTKMRRTLAMAILKPDGPLWHCESFLKEAYLTASLEHPNIISVFDVGLKEDDNPYFIMELKVGETLEHITKNSKDINELLQVYLKVCDAISYAHSCDILHLDIKPDNIQVGAHGEVKLCDWGLACKVEEIDDDSELIRGTPGFMSPEQINKEPISFHTDIFSLGALLYYMLTGAVPFEGGLETKLTNTLKGNFESPLEKELDTEISSSLDAVVRRAMATEAGDRYSSVEELKAEVTNFLTGHSTSAENAGFLKECLLFYKRNKQSCLVACVFLIILSLTITAFVLNLNKSNKQIAQNLVDLQLAKDKEAQAYEVSKQNYEKYIEQKEAQIRASTELKVKNLDEARSVVRFPLYFSEPEASLKKSLVVLEKHFEENKDIDIEQEIIINLFLLQKFSRIQNYTPTYTEPLVEIGKRFSHLEPSEKGILEFDDFVLLLKALNNLEEEHRGLKDSVFERLVYCYKARRKVTFLHRKIVFELVKNANPEWQEDRFEYDKLNKKLVVSGRGLNTICGTGNYSSQKCFFTLMSLDALALRKTRVSKVAHFAGLNLKRLDLRNTKVRTLNPFSAFKGISSIEVDGGQIPDEMLKDAPDYLEILIDE